MDDFHWLNGLEEYFTVTGQEFNQSKIHRIKQSLMDGNSYAIRELMIDEIKRGWGENSQSFVKLIMHQLFDEETIELSNRRILKYISHCIEDEFIKKISSWSIKWGDKTNLSDHFSRGQMKSKFWLISELNTLEYTPQNVAIYGGWYATIVYFLFYNWGDELKRVRNFEIDEMAIAISDNFNYEQYNQNWRFKATVADVSTIKWNEWNQLSYIIKNRNGVNQHETLNADLIINTSCEHMDNSWFENIPEGKLIALQTNDYFSNEQHVNCCQDLTEAKEKYKFSNIYYSGTLDTGLYNRFMIIGRK